jgi:LuxR family maltose regulon positive regulatory protein
LANRKAKSPGERIKFLHKAEQLYQDDYFYEYPYVHFLEFEREYNKKIYINILKELANHYWNQGQYEESMNYFDKIIEKDPYQEEVYEIYIQKLLDTNFVLRAKKVADLYCRYIEKELGVPVKEKITKWFAL